MLQSLLGVSHTQAKMTQRTLTSTAVNLCVGSKQTVRETKSMAAGEAPGSMSVHAFAGNLAKVILSQSGYVAADSGRQR